MKKILFILLLIIWFIPKPSHAQVDQRCWLEQECYDARKSYLRVETPRIGEAGWKEVFRQDNTTKQLCGGEKDAAGKKIGFCLPTSGADTKISIGGVNKFAGLPEFISFIYRYGMSVAGILAILVIIFAGVQWTISAGNTEAISSAQHKIYGAVIGLVILAAAYTILYTVNPDLVNLRPPNAWMINTQKIADPYCGEVKGNISKNPSNPTGQALSREQKAAGFSSVREWVSTSTARCGSDYYVQSTGALTCTGTGCDPGTVCYAKDTTQLSCNQANFAGTIKNGDVEANLLSEIPGIGRVVFGEGWTWPWVGNDSTKEMEIYMVCNNGTHSQLDIDYPQDPVKNVNPVDKTQKYALSTTNAEINEEWSDCNDEGGPKGFVLAAEFNESGESSDVIGGLEEHMIGRPLGTNAGGVFQGFDLMNSSNDWDECIFRNAPAEHFFSKEELISGIKLDINAANIADIDNSDEDAISRKIYYAGEKAPGGEFCN